MPGRALTGEQNETAVRRITIALINVAEVGELFFPDPERMREMYMKPITGATLGKRIELLDNFAHALRDVYTNPED